MNRDNAILTILPAGKVWKESRNRPAVPLQPTPQDPTSRHAEDRGLGSQDGLRLPHGR